MLDLQLVLPSERMGQHQLRAVDRDGSEYTFFIGEADHLLYQWRSHEEYPAELPDEDAEATETEREAFSRDSVTSFHPQVSFDADEAHAVEELPGHTLDSAVVRAAARAVHAPAMNMDRESVPRVMNLGIALSSSLDGWSVGDLLPGPAQRAGIRRGDFLLSVDGDDVTRRSRGYVLQRLRGTPGTTVQLALLRGSERWEASLERGAITPPADW